MTSYINPRKLWTGAWVPEWLMERREVTAGAKLCYARLCQFFNEEKGYAWPGQAKLAECLGTNVRQVQRYIAELVGCCLIETAKENGFDRSNRYRFLWHGWMSSPMTTNPASSKTTNPAREENQLRESVKSEIPPSLSPPQTLSLGEVFRQAIGKTRRLNGEVIALSSMRSRFGEDRVRAAILEHVTQLAEAVAPLSRLESILARMPAPPPAPFVNQVTHWGDKLYGPRSGPAKSD